MGAPTARKTVVMLQPMLRVAVEWQRIASKPRVRDEEAGGQDARRGASLPR